MPIKRIKGWIRRKKRRAAVPGKGRGGGGKPIGVKLTREQIERLKMLRGVMKDRGFQFTHDTVDGYHTFLIEHRTGANKGSPYIRRSVTIEPSRRTVLVQERRFGKGTSRDRRLIELRDKDNVEKIFQREVDGLLDKVETHLTKEDWHSAGRMSLAELDAVEGRIDRVTKTLKDTDDGWNLPKKKKKPDADDGRRFALKKMGRIPDGSGK